MPYPSAAALVALADDPILTAASPSQQEGWRRGAIAAVESYANQSFDIETAELWLDGNGREILPLPARAVTIRKVTAGGLDAADTDLSGDRYSLRVTPFGSTWLERAQEREWGHGRWWPRGEANIYVEGDFGWEAVPEPVVAALAEEMAEQARIGDEPLSSSVTAYRKLGIASMSQGNLAFSLAASGGGVNPRGLSAGAIGLIPRSLVRRVGTGFVV